MMYGMGMPILFPLAALNFINQWICERLVVAWYMRLPPSLSDILMRNMIDKLKFAPLIFIFNGWWMISNEQIFHNQWQWIETIGDGMKSKHYVHLSPRFKEESGVRHVSHAAPI